MSLHIEIHISSLCSSYIEPDYNPIQEHEGFFERIFHPHRSQHKKDKEEDHRDDKDDRSHDQDQLKEPDMGKAKDETQKDKQPDADRSDSREYELLM